jgi:hypothetical protein
VPVETATSTFFTGCKTLQASVNGAANQAMAAIVSGAVGALTSLANGAPLEGAFPKDFYSGTGGAFDKARRDVKSQVEKLYKPVESRLKKTINLLGKDGAVLTAALRPPAYTEDYFFWEDSSSASILQFGLDIILAVNRSGFTEDGRVWLGGAAQGGVDEVTATVVGAINESNSVSAIPVNGRWAAALTDNGTLFRKGNYIAFVKAESDAGGIGDAVFSFR